MVRFYSSPFRMLLSIGFVMLMSPNLSSAQNNWVPDTVGLSSPVTSLAINAGGDLFAGAATSNGSYNGVYRLLHKATSWTPTPQSPSEFPLGPVYGIDPKGNIFVGGSYEYFSSNDGVSWNEIRINPQSGNDPEIAPRWEDFAIGTDGYMFVASNGGPLWVTSDYGTDWYNQGVDNGNQFDFPLFVAYDPTGFYFAGNIELFKSDGATGGTWGHGTNNAIIGAPSSGFGEFVSFAFNSSGLGVNSTIIVAGGSNGLFLSTNNVTQWTTITPGAANLNTVFALAIGKNGNIYAGLSTGGMYASPDTGKTWNDISSGLTSNTVNALAIDTGGTLYAGTNNGVFQYLTSTYPAPPSGVKSGTSDAPSSLTLEQNTPNPVTSGTSIQFTVPEAGTVSLNVFDATGREVATVASGYYAPGTYSVSLDAHSLGDGAYYYRITSGGQTAARMFVIEH